MAYINFEFGYAKNLTNIHLIAIQAIHQNSNGDCEFVLNTIPNQILIDLNDMELLTKVKPKNKTQKSRALLRLSKKGKDLYTSLTTYKSNEGDLLIYKFLSEVYIHLDKKQASKNKMLKLISAFRLESGMSSEEMYKLCKAFVNDEDNMKFNHSLEYVFFKPENAYAKFNLGDSRLWNYYLQNGK